MRNFIKLASQIALVISILPFVDVAAAEETSAPPLIANFVHIPPYGILEENGEQSGFAIELAKDIATEIGVDIEFLEGHTLVEALQMQAPGETHIIAGVARLPILEETNLFSTPVATESLHLTTLSENAPEISGKPLTGLKIGIVQPVFGSSSKTLLDDNIPVNFSSVEEALFHLYAKDIDAVLLPTPLVFSLSKRANFDSKISFINPPIAKIVRHVAIHRSREELFGKVNEAVETLEANGRLGELRNKYFLNVPEPPSDVLTVGVRHTPPLTIRKDDGTYSGFAVDVLNDLANLTGINLRYRELTREERRTALSTALVDLLPIMAISEARRKDMDFSHSVLSISASAFVRTEDTRTTISFDEIEGTKVATMVRAMPKRALGRLKDAGANVNDSVTAEAALMSVIRENADLALLPEQFGLQAAEEYNLTAHIKVLSPPLIEAELAPALRFGLGEVRERFNTVIPGYLVSEKYAALQRKYFGEPIFWTKPRIYMLAATILLIMLGLTAYLFWQRQLRIQKQRELELEQEHSVALSKLVSKLEYSNNELTRFAYICSHDLQQPLRMMKGFSEMLGERLAEIAPKAAQDEKVSSYFGHLQKGADNGRELIKGILEYSKLGHDKDTFDSVDCNEILEEIATIVNEDGNKASLVVLNDLPTISGIRTQIYQLFFNLVSNGLKYARPDIPAKATVRVAEDENYWVFEISDNGIGIDPKHTKSIFEIFRRLHRKDDYPGIGIGLSICKKIIDNHHGSVEVKSTPGEGSTFIVSLPRV